MQKAAVIGAGYIAREHLDALRRIPEVELVGICDLSPAIAEATAEEFGVARWYTDHRKMFAEIRPDVVHITTPPRSHVPLVVDALQAGAHVFVEKPIATNLEEFEKVRSLAGERGLRVVEDYNYLFNPSVRRIRDLIASGEFGEVIHVDVHFCVDVLGAGSKHADRNIPGPFQELPGGPVLDFITHLAYLAHAFIGEHCDTHTAWLKRTDNEFVAWDEFRALVEAERATACIGFSSHAQPDIFSVRVHGTRMRATASLFEPLLGIERVHNGPRPLLPVWNGLSVGKAYISSAIGGLWRKLQGRPGTYEGLSVLLHRFYDELDHGAEPPVTLDQMVAVNRLVWDLLAGAEAK